MLVTFYAVYHLIELKNPPHSCPQSNRGNQ